MLVDFKTISLIKFKDVLDWLQIQYTETKTELRGEGFVINLEKNLYFNPTGQDKGSIINFVSTRKNLSLRDAAIELKKKFLDPIREPKRPIPNLTLHYCDFLKDYCSEPNARDLEVGLVKEKSIMAGKIAFKMFGPNKEHVGYIGFDPEKLQWFFPKHYKNDYLWNFHYAYKANMKVVHAAPDPLVGLVLIQNGHLNTVAFTSRNPTDAQIEQICRFKAAQLNIAKDDLILKLARRIYVLAPPD